MAQHTFMEPLSDPKNKNKINYADSYRQIKINDLDKVLASNKIFSRDDIEWYDKFSRFGYVDPYNTDQISREFLFFTKPDLWIYDGKSYSQSTLRKELSVIPFFVDADNRHGDALKQLQYSLKDRNGVKNPFMYLLSNAVTSKLDLPSISSESRESTSNIMGVNIQYRGHSFKSDNGYDFSLSFSDTARLEIYTLLKAYDEYIRMLKMGEVSPFEDYIINKILSEQFSIYKFLIGSDGETILYYAKLTGCFFTDVPRNDFGDPGNDGFKYSASFHAQFVEDNNPMILSEFNRITPAKNKVDSNGNVIRPTFVNTYNYDLSSVDNSWVRWPVIVPTTADEEYLQNVRKSGTGKSRIYKLKWTNNI